MRECKHNLSQAAGPSSAPKREGCSHLINLAKYYGKNNIRLDHKNKTSNKNIIYICKIIIYILLI